MRVVLLEAGRIGHGVTGHTTAKISSQHGLIYARLRSRFGAGGARIYGEANEAALDWIARPRRARRDRVRLPPPALIRLHEPGLGTLEARETS